MLSNIQTYLILWIVALLVNGIFGCWSKDFKRGSDLLANIDTWGLSIAYFQTHTCQPAASGSERLSWLDCYQQCSTILPDCSAFGWFHSECYVCESSTGSDVIPTAYWESIYIWRSYLNSISIQDVNECDHDPCNNGAICQDEEQGYTCLCTSAYMGQHCGLVKPNCNTDIGSCYHFSDTKMSVAAGNTYCDDNGFYLVSVDSMQEFEFIRGLISECSNSDVFKCCFWTAGVTHSLSDAQIRSNYNQQIYTETEWWAPTQPSSGVDKCIFFYITDDFYFHDGNCGTAVTVICEENIINF